MAARLGLVLYIFSWVIGAIIAMYGIFLIFLPGGYQGAGVVVIVFAALIVGVGRGIYYVLAGR